MIVSRLLALLRGASGVVVGQSVLVSCGSAPSDQNAAGSATDSGLVALIALKVLAGLWGR